MIPPKEQALFKTINDEKQLLFGRLISLSEDKLKNIPQGSTWSVLHVIKHLITSEKLSLMYLKKKWAYAPSLKSAGIITNIRFMGLQLANWSPFKLKAPEPVRINKVDESLSEIMIEWDTIRDEMNKFLNELPEEVYSKEFYKHPAVGKLRVRHMLTFFRDHIARHTKQIERLIRS